MQQSLKYLQQLNQMKQDRLNARLKTLMIQEAELQQQIYQKQVEIDNLHNERRRYKINAYTEKLKNLVLKSLDIKVIEFQLGVFSQQIEETLQQQHELSKQLDELQQQIKTTRSEIKYHIIKIEKYNYCQELLGSSY